MTKNRILHLIVGKWRTLNHSTKKEFDDSHEVKAEILKKIGKKNFSKQVGNNPDIGITEQGMVILKGVGEKKHKPYYVTEISAEDYFVLRFFPFQDSNETEIQILILKTSKPDDRKEFNIISHLHQLYIIPNNEKIVLTLIESLTNEYIQRSSGQVEDFIILFHS